MIADGCQTPNVACFSSPAAAKNAVQSSPGAFFAKSAFAHGLFVFVTSWVSTWFQCAWAICFSSAKIAFAFCSASAIPASLSIEARCCSYFARTSAKRGLSTR